MVDTMRGLDEMVNTWIDAKVLASGSEKTRIAYLYTIQSLRSTLACSSIDLDGPSHLVAEAIQRWANMPHPNAHNQQSVSAATVNQRISIISSWYTYVLKRYRDETTITENPIECCSRPRIQPYMRANDPVLDVIDILQRIDCSVLSGQQAYAIIGIAMHTGRQVADIAQMQIKDLTIYGKQVTVAFPRLKQARLIQDVLPPVTARMLMQYLYAWYNQDLSSLPEETPVWVTLDHNQHYGKALSIRTIQRIGTTFCKTNFQSLRANFVIEMEKVGCKVGEREPLPIHSQLETTRLYITSIK